MGTAFAIKIGLGTICTGVEMRITNAVYQLSEIQRTRVELRGRAGRARPSAPAPSSGTESQSGDPPKRSPVSHDQPLSLSEMLHEHFVDEVRRRDHDGDGRLSRSEFGGSREEFDSLDRAGKGFINARDLAREALARNADLKKTVAGPWTPIYESLLHVEEPTDDNLLNAVRDGAVRLFAQTADDPEGPGTLTRPTNDQITALSADFLMSHEDLSGLHGRLQTLANRLGRFRRYSPVDCVG